MSSSQSVDKKNAPSNKKVDKVFAAARIDFMRWRYAAMLFSVGLLLLSVLLISMRGLNLGLDFSGGILVEAEFAEPVDVDALRSTLVDGGYPSVEVQNFGSSRDVLVRIPPRDGENDAIAANMLVDAVSAQFDSEPEIRRVEFVGPKVGSELRDQGGLAVIYALFAIVIYVWLRFEKKFSVGGVLALVHDVTITLGFFALTQIEFDLTVLAAILAVVGYSLNDTIVVYDRIRENFLRIRVDEPVRVVNLSLNQTLTRTLITSGTTLMVVLALQLFGGDAVGAFAAALNVGIIVGTYSSIYVAAACILWMNISRADLMPAEKEEEEEAMP